MPITKVDFDTAIDLETTSRQAANVAKSKRDQLRALIDSWGVLSSPGTPGQEVSTVVVNHNGTFYRVTRQGLRLVDVDSITTE